MLSPQARLIQKVLAQRAARQAAATGQPAINIVGTPVAISPAPAPKKSVIQRIIERQQAAKALVPSGPLVQAPSAPPIISGHSGDSLPVNSNGGSTGVAPLSLASSADTGLTETATSTGTQAENAKSFIQIIAVAALIWVGWGYLEKRG